MKKESKTSAIIFALLAAVFYAINVPFSKRLLEYIPPTFTAAFLYLGAGVGIGILYLFRHTKEGKSEHLTKADLPYTTAMILLDIAAPIFLMVGINIGKSANASLLGNFEIVATALIARLIFGERISPRLWSAVALITVSSAVLSFEGTGSFSFSVGSLFVILATCCWGIENNCTRKISGKSAYEIVILKGIFSGLGSFIISFVIGEQIPPAGYIILTMLLGFISYGLSIFLYVRAQRTIGAAKTSAYYAVAPFIGAGLSFIINGDKPVLSFIIALCIMIIGIFFVIKDTLESEKAD